MVVVEEIHPFEDLKEQPLGLGLAEAVAVAPGLDLFEVGVPGQVHDDMNVSHVLKRVVAFGQILMVQHFQHVDFVHDRLFLDGV